MFSIKNSKLHILESIPSFQSTSHGVNQTIQPGTHFPQTHKNFFYYHSFYSRYKNGFQINSKRIMARVILMKEAYELGLESFLMAEIVEV